MGEIVGTLGLVRSASLDALTADPARAAQLPPEAARILLASIAGLLPILIAASAPGEHITEAASDSERWLSVHEAAHQFHVTPRWLYRHKSQLPHSQPSRKVLLFPASKLERWFAARKHC